MALKPTGDRSVPPVVGVEPTTPSSDVGPDGQTLRSSDTTRIGSLLPVAPTGGATLLSPTAIRDADAAVEVVEKNLSLGIADWAVTDREARRAIEALRGLDADALRGAVDRIEPQLLTRLLDNLPRQERTAYADTIDRLNAARNEPSVPAADFGEVVPELRRDLEGLLKLDFVTANGARSAIDRFRRLSSADRERALEALGPSRAYRMIDNLSETDRTVFAPTIDTVKNAFFGRLLSDSEAVGLGPEDKTTDLVSLLGDVAAGRHERPADIGDYAYYLVPGLVTEHQPGYMDVNAEHLQSLGLDVTRSKIDTDGDVESNAEVIRREIAEIAARTGKKVVMISHSKGGPDAAEALQDESTEDLVHRFIPMQPAMATPVASTLTDSPIGGAIETAFTDLLGAANGEGLSDLGFAPSRERFLRGRPLTVPILTLASTVGDHFSALRGVSDLIEDRYGVTSDGLVTIDEQFVPGRNSFRAVLDGVDHTAPCSRPLPGTPALKYDQAVMTEALVCLALRL